MIFVLTGVHEHGFDRLVKEIDSLAQKKIINNAFIQIGYSKYQPRYCKWEKAIEFYEFEDRLNQADLIITHGGAGCIAGALERQKTIIVVPRLKKFNEHNNDHQLELTSVLERSGRVLACYDMKDLPGLIKKAKNFKPNPVLSSNIIINIIQDYLKLIKNNYR